MRILVDYQLVHAPALRNTIKDKYDLCAFPSPLPSSCPEHTLTPALSLCLPRRQRQPAHCQARPGVQ